MGALWIYVILLLSTVVTMLTAVTSLGLAGNTSVRVMFVVILPADQNRMFSISNVQPALEYAIEQVRDYDILASDVIIDVAYSDSRCNAKEAPVAAFRYYMQGDVNLFLGPVCDYSLEPVALYVPYWDIPVISPGGFAHDFGNKTIFGMLTRIGLTFNSLAHALTETLKHFRVKLLRFIYVSDAFSNVNPDLCYLAGSAFIHNIKHVIEYQIFKYMPGEHNIEEMLREEIGVSYSGK